MNIRSSSYAALIGVLGLLGGGCRASTVRSYQTCIYDSDCIVGTDTCVEVVHNGAATHICTSRCVSGGAACPSDAYGAIGTCVSFDSGSRFFCYQSCTPGSTLCEYGTSCVNVSGTGSANICLPGGGGTSTVPAYSGCAGGMVCQAGTSCVGVHDRRTIDLCTVSRCARDSDCPRDRRGGTGLCISLDGDSFGTCVERCNTTSDCTYGSMGVQSCVTYTNAGVSLPVPACLPN